MVILSFESISDYLWAMPHPDEGFSERVSRVREIIANRNLEAIVLRRNPNLAWFTGGRVHVPSAIDLACFDLIVTSDSLTVVTNAIEAPRLIAEELPNTIEVVVIPWWDGRDAQLPTGEKIGTDQPAANRSDVSLEIEMARASLTAFDAQRLEKISLDAAGALGRAMKEVVYGDREIDVAGRITHALWESNLDTVFLGVAGENRAHTIRHALPTSEVIGGRVVASICARRKGLIASATRIVTFGPQNESDLRRYENLLEVEAALLDATVVGVAFKSDIEAVQKAYPAYGFDPEEWTKHHQGGPTGYLPRDWPATQFTERLIADAQPVSWNPTGSGWKVEDTWLTGSDGPVLLTQDSAWPSVICNSRSRPGILKR